MNTELLEKLCEVLAAAALDGPDFDFHYGNVGRALSALVPGMPTTEYAALLGYHSRDGEVQKWKDRWMGDSVAEAQHLESLNAEIARLIQEKAELVAALERCVNDWIWLVQNPGAPIAGTARMDHGVIEAQSIIAKAKGDQ